MGTLNEDLTGIKAIEDKLTANKIANFAYTDHAYNNPLTEADGVTVYDVNHEQNIPVADPTVLNVNETVLSKGWRSQASAITRMLMNHFLGRVSYNLNKLNDNFSATLATIMSHLGQPNGIATLDANGRIPYAQLPESAIEYEGNWNASTNTPTLVNGTGTKGDFYICNVAGTVDFGDGAISFLVNDRVIYDGAVWSKLSAGDVRTVNGIAPDSATGNVQLVKGDIGLGSVANTGDSANALSGGTTKFTTGGAYNLLISLASIFSTGTAYAVGNIITYQNRLYECTTAHSAGAWNSSHFTARSVEYLLRTYILPSLAPVFSASTAYTVGQFVIYQNKLYRCTTAHSAGAWNSSHFTLANLNDVNNASVASGTLPIAHGGTGATTASGAKSNIGLGNVVNTGDSATPVSGGTTKFTTGGAYTELAKKVNNADSCAYKYYGSSNGTTKYITITFNDTYGSIIVTTGYNSNLFFLVNKGTPFSDASSTTYGVTGYAWSSDGKILYLKVGGYRPIAVTLPSIKRTEVGTIGSSGIKVNFSDAVTTAPSGVTFVTTTGQIDTVASRDSALNAKADKTTTVNGHALSGNVTVTKGDVGLGSVANTGDSATPVSGGTTKFTSGGAYNFFGGNTKADTWLNKVFGWALGYRWIQGTGSNTNYDFHTVYYANGIWVAGSEIRGLWWSTDGKAWTRGTGSMTTYSFLTVYYANGIWVAGTEGRGLWWSTDGKAWTQVTGTTVSHGFSSVHYANGIWVATSYSYGLWWSTDGKTWTQGTGVSTSYGFNAVYYGNGIWVAGSEEHSLWWSTDGKAWTQGTGSDTSYGFNTVYYADGIWVAGGNSNRGIWWSTDGKAWTRGGNYAPYVTTNTVYYANGVWVAGCEAGGLLWSWDGKDWRKESSTDTTTVHCLYYANGVWVAACATQGCYRSHDGMNWMKTSSPHITFNTVHFANNIWVIGSDYNGLWWSNYDNADFE